MNGWHSGSGSGREGRLPVELPPRTDAGAPPGAADPEPRLVAPLAPRTPLPRLALRIAVGSIGLALAVGVAVGRLTALESARPVSKKAPAELRAELRIRGAGHLNAFSDPEVLGAGGLFADAAAIRERLLATGVPKKVSVERALTGGVLVDIEEKRAVALLDWEPPAALAEDGTVLGPATAADLAWAGAADLVLVRGADRTHRDFAARRLVGRPAGGGAVAPARAGPPGLGTGREWRPIPAAGGLQIPGAPRPVDRKGLFGRPGANSRAPAGSGRALAADLTG